jgi:hypothetical protein
MEQFLFEPVELTDAELDAVAGGDGAAAAAAGDGLNAAAGASGGVTITLGGFTATADHVAFAVNLS